ncbi:MAG TPA: PASTA domain-containing protein [Nitrospirota bacterium]|nr:PASTA domain-containing protein [Nitrospirota bacterium]
MKRFLRGLGIFLALVGVGIVSAFAVIALLLQQEEVRVPDLTGKDIVTVLDMVRQQGLELKVDRREPHPTLPRDSVISQSPVAGNGIKKGRQVRVVVSQGPSDTQTPKLAGEPYRKADLMIRQAGFVPGTVSRISSESIDRDIVIAQDPPTGSQLDKGGAISLLVSSGRKAEMFVMPKLTGKRLEETVKTIDRLGLQRRVIYKAAGEKTAAAERTVIQQKPGAGSPVAADAMVDIVVSN